MTDTGFRNASRVPIRVHFGGTDFDHEMKLSESFVRGLPSIDLELTPASTVDEVYYEAARELLLALAYEDTGRGVLELKSSMDALALRDTWIAQESSHFETAMEELIDPEPRARRRFSRLRGKAVE